MTRRAAALLLACVALAGCGGDSEGGPAGVVKETADNLGDVRSGKLRLTMKGGAEDAPDEVGFSVDGLFAFAEDRGGLPVADMTVTRFAGGERAEAQVISTGEDAFVEAQGRAYRLPEEQERQLRAAGAGGAGLGGLDIDKWMRDPEVSDAGGGTERVTGRLDVAAAANDLLELAGSEPLGESQREQLERAVESGRVELITGKDDRILRRLTIDLRLGFDRIPAELRERFKGYGGASFKIELALAEPNSEVRVSAPEGAEPLPAGGG